MQRVHKLITALSVALIFGAVACAPGCTSGGPTNQCGEPRPGGTMCDAGAVEVQP
jgi:hypothetical protein